MIVFVAPVGDS